MGQSDIVKAENENVNPFSFDFGTEFIKENLPAEKRTELAVVAQSRRLDLAQDVAKRTIRLQASSADMDQTLRTAGELSRGSGDFVITSSHDTASGRTEITVRRHSLFAYLVVAITGLIVLMWLMR